MAGRTTRDSAASHRVQEYLEHLDALFDNVQAWVREIGLSPEKRVTKLHEELGGRYQAPRLLIRTIQGQRVAELEPVGAHVIAALGRVDLCGTFDTVPIVYLARAGPALKTRISGSGMAVEEEVSHTLFRGVDHDDWYTLELGHPGRARRIDRETFLELVGRVSDYAARLR